MRVRNITTPNPPERVGGASRGRGTGEAEVEVEAEALGFKALNAERAGTGGKQPTDRPTDRQTETDRPREPVRGGLRRNGHSTTPCATSHERGTYGADVVGKPTSASSAQRPLLPLFHRPRCCATGWHPSHHIAPHSGVPRRTARRPRQLSTAMGDYGTHGERSVPALKSTSCQLPQAPPWRSCSAATQDGGDVCRRLLRAAS